jgi:hypothetical protein
MIRREIGSLTEGQPLVHKQARSSTSILERVIEGMRWGTMLIVPDRDRVLWLWPRRTKAKPNVLAPADADCDGI